MTSGAGFEGAESPRGLMRGPRVLPLICNVPERKRESVCVWGGGGGWTGKGMEPQHAGGAI